MKFIGGLILMGLGVIGWATAGHHPPPHYVLASTGLVILGFILTVYGACRGE
jgi:hypothetical protein